MDYDMLPDLPDGWVWATLGDICADPQYGYTTRASNVPYGPKFLRITDLSYGSVDWSTVPYCEEAPEDSEKFRLFDGDIVIARSGSVGKAYRVIMPPDAVFASYLIRFRPLMFGMGRYIEYFLQSPFYWQQIADSSSGNTIFNVNAQKMKALVLPLAPYNEQLRIVEAIETQFTRIDEGVRLLQRLRDNLKRYKAAVLKAACEGRLVPQDPADEPASDLLKRILRERRAQWQAEGRKGKYVEPQPPDTTDLPDLPDGWVWASAEELGNVQLGRQRSPKNRSKDYPTKYIRAANITESGLDLSDLLDMEFKPHEKEIYRMAYGDIVISEASGSPDQVGKPAVWRNEIEECCFQNTVIRLRPTLINSFYLLAVFRHFYINGIFARIAAGVGINHLSAGKFSRIPIPIAPLNEQERIVDEVDRQLSIIEELDTVLKLDFIRAERLRQSILKQAFEGKLVPQDPNDEPASVLLHHIQASRKQGRGKK